jgi:hypothetical protein
MTPKYNASRYTIVYTNVSNTYSDVSLPPAASFRIS